MTVQPLAGRRTEASNLNATDPNGGNYGEVFTKRWVVDLVLDLVGYRPARDLGACRLVDPACGDGAFVLPALQRLLESAQHHGRPFEDLRGAVRAYDLQEQHVETLRRLVCDALEEAGAKPGVAEDLAIAWVQHRDFLLTDVGEGTADFVVGNPPYIRFDELPRDRVALYQRICSTMRGRCDIYIGFFEIGLTMLRPDGKLGFICADRWMKSAYGKDLRDLVSKSFGLRFLLEMHKVDAFEDQVSAYPAITVIGKNRDALTVVASASERFGEAHARELVALVDAGISVGVSHTIADGTEVARLATPLSRSSRSWPTGSPARLALLTHLEASFPPLEDHALRVGIGVATGADKVFILQDEGAVERDRLIPMVTTRDIRSGIVEWAGNYLVNPWAGPRTLVNLDEYPCLRRYLHENEEVLRRRHTARRDQSSWYRTIDPVHTDLTDRPKLLFPDMKLNARPVLEPGGLYPHHNLYYVVSDIWDLEVLGALLSSSVAQLFIEAYSVRMRGGTLRFQAQYMRRIRLPILDTLSSTVRQGLRDAFRRRDFIAMNALALEAYSIDEVPGQ